VCPSRVGALAVEKVRLPVASSWWHCDYFLRRDDSERQRFLYWNDGERFLPRRKFVEVDSTGDDLLVGH
jgi:hypothetical protein